ncbi:MAG: glyoxalase [Acidobacteria bacterium]|nr:glyoxalase [Acidobacteriota bacterium]
MTRRCFLLVALCAAPSLHADGGVKRASAVEGVSITVSDLDRSVRFYTGVLGFERMDERETAGAALEQLTGVFGARTRSARLRLGDEQVELVEYLAPEGRAFPAGSRGNDLWFQHIAIIVSDMARAYSVLRSHNVRHASTGPQRLPDWNPNAGGIEAFYFRDPDGHFLEILAFPAGKGDPKWRRSTAKLFLGIDHTAITVADTERSLRFYRDALGMRVAGASENHGTEQEHLNQVFGARLRITALRAPSGFGIELLEYLSPTGGRRYPEDARANDLLHWHTTLATPDADDAVKALRGAGAAAVSSGKVDGAFLLRDPDGHALLLRERRGQ